MTKKILHKRDVERLESTSPVPIPVGDGSGKGFFARIRDALK